MLSVEAFDFKPIVWWLVTLYPGICLGYYIFHRFFIMHPSRKITRTPDALGLKYSEIFFPSAKHVRLQGWYISAIRQNKNRHQRSVILFFPGNEGTLSKFLDQMPPLATAGFDILMFSYRGFGKSSLHWPLESGLRQDALGAWDYLTKTRGLIPSQIIFYAQSLGCGLASWAASQCHPRALILEGGFPSVPEITAHNVPWLPVRWLTREVFNTRQHLGQVTCPVLIAHSQDDQAIPFGNSQQLFAAARQPKAFFTLRGEHARGMAVMPQEYIRAIIAFLSKKTRG